MNMKLLLPENINHLFVFERSICCDKYMYIYVHIHACICAYICIYIRMDVRVLMYVYTCVTVSYSICYLLIVSVLWILTFEQRMVILW